MSDPAADGVNLTPAPRTVAALNAVESPRPAGNDLHLPRITPQEYCTFTVSATIVGFKVEQDGDYHIVLHDGGKSMIVEIPFPDFVPASAYKGRMATARDAFTAAFNARITANVHDTLARFAAPTLSWLTGEVVQLTPVIPRSVNVTGVCFFDFNHGQTGVADNALELHPVLDFAAV